MNKSQMSKYPALANKLHGKIVKKFWEIFKHEVKLQRGIF